MPYLCAIFLGTLPLLMLAQSHHTILETSLYLYCKDLQKNGEKAFNFVRGVLQTFVVYKKSFQQRKNGWETLM